MATARVANPLNRFIDFERGRWNAYSHDALPDLPRSQPPLEVLVESLNGHAVACVMSDGLAMTVAYLGPMGTFWPYGSRALIKPGVVGQGIWVCGFKGGKPADVWHFVPLFELPAFVPGLRFSMAPPT